MITGLGFFYSSMRKLPDSRFKYPYNFEKQWERGLQYNRTDIFWSKSTYCIEIIFSSFQRLLCRFKSFNSVISSYLRKPVVWRLRSYLQVANNSTSRNVYIFWDKGRQQMWGLVITIILIQFAKLFQIKSEQCSHLYL